MVQTMTDNVAIREELHRLHESQMVLLLMAEEMGMRAPRGCCPHFGNSACTDCAAAWLAAEAHRIAAREMADYGSAG
jgi:hypothetical protein